MKGLLFGKVASRSEPRSKSRLQLKSEPSATVMKNSELCPSVAVEELTRIAVIGSSTVITETFVFLSITIRCYDTDVILAM